MCQNPNLSSEQSPIGHPVLPSSSKKEREAMKHPQVQDYASILANGDALARIQAARDIRKIARESPRSRSAFAVPSIIQPLVIMLQSSDHASTESSLLAILNLAVRNEQNKDRIVSSGAVPHLVELLKSDKRSLREAAAAGILTLSASDSNKPAIAGSGAVPLLVGILASGSTQGRVDALTALHNIKASPSEAADPLVAFLRNGKKCPKLADKAAALLLIISGSEDGRRAVCEAEGGVLAVVETVEFGSAIGSEHAAGVLLSLCRSGRGELILDEGPVPGLLLLTLEGTQTARERARRVLDLLRRDYSG